MLLLVASVWPAAMSLVDAEQVRNWGITEAHLSPSFTGPISRHNYPEQIELPGLALEGPLTVRYTLDPGLQQEVERLLKRHNPDYGIFVALDPDTGRILAMADSRRDGIDDGNLSMINTYPAASISKIITKN